MDKGKDAEDSARLAGLVAVLGLPSVRCDDNVFRYRCVEIRIAPTSEHWVVITGMAITADGYTFDGADRVTYKYAALEGVPEWRHADGTYRDVSK